MAVIVTGERASDKLWTGHAEADRVAFAEWVEPYLAVMSRLAARLAPTAERDDVVQEALSRAWAKRMQFDPQRGSSGAWLLTITANCARSARQTRAALREIDMASEARSPEHVDIERAIGQLPARQRLAVNCFYFAGLSVAETAAAMRCSEGTVKSTLAEARHRLRKLLEVYRG